MHLLMFLKSRFTVVTIRCILAVRWSRNQLIFTWSTLIGCRNGYLLIGWGSWTELAALQRKLFLVWKCVAMSFFCNTHYGGPVPLLGDEFEFAAVAVAWRGGPNHSLPFIQPPLAEWMNDAYGPDSDWCLMMVVMMYPREVIAGKEPRVLRMMRRVTWSITMETC